MIAHELGHVKRNHILKALAWYALFAFPGAYIISRVTRRRGGMGEPAAVPLALLTLVVLELLALPLQNAITRHMEAEADWLALQTTRDPKDAAALFRQFVGTGLSDPGPPTWEYLLAEDHPTIDQRIAMVRAWQARYARVDVGGPAAVELGVAAAAGEQLVVRALLDDRAVLEHDDQVRVGGPSRGGGR